MRKEIIGPCTLYLADCRDVLPSLTGIHAAVTDPPYHLTTASRGGSPRTNNPATPFGRTRLGEKGFMGKTWDGGDIAFRPELWEMVAHALLPGAHLLAFSGTRTCHRMTCAIEDAGFEVRDRIRFECSMQTKYGPFWDSLSREQQDRLLELLNEVGLGSELAWTYASGFPKSRNLDGVWQGWGSALKPSFEPVAVARKPMVGTLAENVQAHGTGALDIDRCRVPIDAQADASQLRTMKRSQREGGDGWGMSTVAGDTPQVVHPEGRWPANVAHDGSHEVLAAFPSAKAQQGAVTGTEPSSKTNNVYGQFGGRPATRPRVEMGQSAARFFFCAKASRSDRNAGCEALVAKPLRWSSGVANPGSFQSEGTDKSAANHHPTVKPTELMRWLCRLVTPPGGIVLDPFMGSGSTGRAAVLEGFRFVGIEQDSAYFDIACRRIEDACRQGSLLAPRPANDVLPIAGGDVA